MAVAAVVLLAIGIPAVAQSDWVHTSYHTAPRKAAVVPAAAPAGALHALWSVRGPAPAGSFVGNGLVVTADPHGLSGRDPRTGVVKWSYRRTNTTLCSWAVQADTAIALFHNGTDCSDLNGFDADSGKRSWYLNSDLVAGTRLVTGNGYFFTVNADQVQGYGINNGNSYWQYDRSTCDLTTRSDGGGPLSDAQAGNDDIVLDTRCAGGVWRLVSVRVFDESGDSIKAGQQVWTGATPGEDPLLVSAQNGVIVLSRVDGHPRYSVYDTAGHALATVPAPGLAASATIPDQAPQARAYSSDDIVFDGKNVTMIDPANGDTRWSVPAVGPISPAGDTSYIPTSTGFVECATATGVQSRKITVPAMPAHVLSTDRIGSELLVATSTGITAYG